MKIKDIFGEMGKFFEKYIPPLSDKELNTLSNKLIKARKELNAREFLGRFCIEMAIAQSVRQERQDGIKFSYYSQCLEYIIMSVPIFQKGKLIGSIGSGSGLFEIFAAKKLFPESYIICMDFSLLCCLKSKKIAEIENANNIDFIVCDALNLPFKEKRFDIIWSFGTLIFNKETTKQFRENIEKILKPTGTAISAE